MSGMNRLKWCMVDIEKFSPDLYLLFFGREWVIPVDVERTGIRGSLPSKVVTGALYQPTLLCVFGVGRFLRVRPQERVPKERSFHSGPKGTRRGSGLTSFSSSTVTYCRPVKKRNSTVSL